MSNFSAECPHCHARILWSIADYEGPDVLLEAAPSPEIARRLYMRASTCGCGVIASISVMPEGAPAIRMHVVPPLIPLYPLAPEYWNPLFPAGDVATTLTRGDIINLLESTSTDWEINSRDWPSHGYQYEVRAAYFFDSGVGVGHTLVEAGIRALLALEAERKNHVQEDFDFDFNPA